MLRKIIVTSIIILCTLSLQAQDKTDREKSNLFGYVKSVEEKSYLIVFRDGKPVKEELEFESTQRFDIDGKEISSSSEFGNEKIIYDENGRVREKIRKVSPHTFLILRKVYSYNEKDQIVEEKGLDTNGNLLGKLTFSYDSKGNLIKKTSEGKRNYYNNYITEQKFNQLNQRIEIATYKNVNGEWKPEDFRNRYYKRQFVYNDNGEIAIEKQIDVNENLYQMNVRRYDEKGNEKETIDYNSEGIVTSKSKYEYTYDEKGNYIKEIWFSSKNDDGNSVYKQTDIVYRKITYYSDKEIKKHKAKTLQKK